MMDVMAGSSDKKIKALTRKDFICCPKAPSAAAGLQAGAGAPATHVAESGRWIYGNTIDTHISKGTAVFLVAEHAQCRQVPAFLAVGEAVGDKVRNCINITRVNSREATCNWEPRA